MKKPILISFMLLVCLFLTGSVIAWIAVGKTMSKMDNLILLHQVEIMREDLIIHIQQVQSQIVRSKTRNGGDVDVLIAHVQEMDKVMDSCLGCHHAPELMQGLYAMRDLTNDYKVGISHLVTATSNSAHISRLEQRAQYLGQELISMAQGMAFTANIHLKQKTLETMATMRDIQTVLVVTLGFGALFAGIALITLTRKLNARLIKLIAATRRVVQGNLREEVETSRGAEDEFDQLANSFNEMMGHIRQAQRQLLQREKLTAIGELATNLAYEINNPLSGATGYTELLLKADDIPESRREHIKRIEREIIRAQEILKRLLDFSRRKPPRLAPVQMENLVADALSKAEQQAVLSQITIENVCSRELPPVVVDADQISQVLHILVDNAFRAMPEGGTLRVECSLAKNIRDNRELTISFSDTGCGIPEESLDRIFDPFFSGQQNGKSIGLDLSIGYMIVHSHGGRIEVDSLVNNGSTFRVILPID